MLRSFAPACLILFFAMPACAQTAAPVNTDRARANRPQAQMDDLANLARYREANSKLGPPAPGENRVVFLGDSITDWWPLTEYFPQRPYVNRGISGQVTSQVLLRLRPDVIELQPKVVVILAGINDLAVNPGPNTVEEIERNLAAMAELAGANGLRVVLASVLPVSDYNRDQANQSIVRTRPLPPAKIVTLNEWIKNYCVRQGLVYLDYHSAMVDRRGLLRAELSYDGLHPNENGYAVMKPLAEQAIQAALKKQQR